MTTRSIDLVQPIHDRMPLILPRAAHQRWLFGEPDDAARVMVPLPGTSMAAHRVSDRVSKPSANGTELIAAVDAP